ncbi:MAG TPA: prepilin-type N-terminal cleavage/methylation domain-containing protein [Candidatus Binatia bacterium]|nr:prepilin-type N-terminal cleavage/methylation domain-containing protein [Candidatus Binatia bacterium]
MRQEGFTLNEILVAMSLIVIGVLGYSLSTVGVIRGNHASDHITAAVNLAQDKLEQLRAQTPLPNANHCPSAGDRNISATATPGGIFHRCWTITSSPLGTKLKRIDVTVSWRDSQDRTLTISTLVFTG